MISFRLATIMNYGFGRFIGMVCEIWFDFNVQKTSRMVGLDTAIVAEMHMDLDSILWQYHYNFGPDTVVHARAIQTYIQKLVWLA